MNLENYNNNNLQFLNPITNTVIDNSEFIRIIYSNKNITFNGIVLLYQIKNARIEKYFNKYKAIYKYNENEKWINKLCEIEKELLKKYAYYTNNNKEPSFVIERQLKCENIKIFFDNLNITPNYVIKISGIFIKRS